MTNGDMSNPDENQVVQQNHDSQPSSVGICSSASAERHAGQNALRQLGNNMSVASLLSSATSTLPTLAASGASDRSDRFDSTAKSVTGTLGTENLDDMISMGITRPSPRKEGWTNVSTDSSTLGRPPCQRSLHAAAVVHDSMYVFGGYDGLNRVNDFYEFYFPSKIWREIKTLSASSEGSASGGGGANVAGGLGRGGGRHQRPYNGTITATGNVPSPRDRHAAVVHRSSFYIFGGFDGTSRVSDLYGFDVDRLVWRVVRQRIAPANAINNVIAENVSTRVTSMGENSLIGQPPHLQLNPGHFGGDDEIVPVPQQFHPPPSPRHSHAAVVYKNCMYVFGGYDGSYRSDFHEFDFDQLTWQPILASGRSPRARYRSTACVRGDMMILFGGHDGTRHLADVHLFDFVNQVWSLLVPNGVPPLPRDSHVSVAYKDSMYVFGGA